MSCTDVVVYTHADANDVVSSGVQSYSVESAEDGEVKDESMAWQEKFIDFFEDEAGSYSDTFTVVYFTARSIDDALAESVTGEIFLFIATCASVLDCHLRRRSYRDA